MAKKRPEPISLAKALHDGPTSPLTPGSNAEFVSRFFRQITSTFPPEVQGLSAIDRLAYYFRTSELAVKENEILIRDEAERRKAMLLMAEKIKLMNQPLPRGPNSGRQ